MEFTFEELEAHSNSAEQRISADPAGNASGNPKAPGESARSGSTANFPDHIPSSHPASDSTQNKTPASKSVRKENPIMEKSNISTHRPISRENIHRQKREQTAIHSILSGIGLAFTCAILMVAALATLGGYVLYKQISNQSASLALLEQNTKQRFFEMETDLVKRDSELAKNLEQTNLRLMNMTASFEEFRSQSMEMLADLRATNKALAKQLTEARKENAEQRMQLARLETSVRIGR